MQFANQIGSSSAYLGFEVGSAGAANGGGTVGLVGYVDDRVEVVGVGQVAVFEVLGQVGGHTMVVVAVFYLFWCCAVKAFDGENGAHIIR